MKQISTPLCNLNEEPNINSSLETQLLFGEKIKIIEKNGKWIFCESIQDNYKGWIKKNCVGDIQSQNFQISSPISYVYKEPDIKSKPLTKLFYNSKINIIEKKSIWSLCDFNGKKGYIYGKHLVSINTITKSNKIWVENAKKFLNVSYLWGGKTFLGLDCSALVQLAIQSLQIPFPRNSNDQFNSQMLKDTTINDIKKGVLVFWDGHVAIALDKNNILHANAFHMKVKSEPFIQANERIKNSHGKLLGFKEFNF